MDNNNWIEGMARNQPAHIIRLQENIKNLSHQTTRKCLDQYALQEAKELVPLSQLVQDNLEILEGDFNDNLLPLVVDWFQTDFFTWFKPPDCEKCDGHIETCSIFNNQQGLRVEKYRCTNKDCDYTYDFIRHRDPAILLKTRRGRCGEWADCFFLFLRALDYEARMVHDMTGDHVWNEVWSETQHRWIHVDPCENAIDKPLLYELGWKKKDIKFCIAFSQYEVLDVTPRYVCNFSAALKLRYCAHDWLEIYTDWLTVNRQCGLSQDKKEEINKRRRLDQVSLKELALNPRNPSQGSYRGRKTGDLSWLLSRGECSATELATKFVIKVHGDGDSFLLRYNSLKNKYESSHTDYDNQPFLKLIYKCSNLNYKYERDWKTSYIARCEGCPHDQIGEVAWKFDLKELKNSSKKVQIYVKGRIYPQTSIDLVLRCFDKDEKQTNKREIKLDQVNELVLDASTATLSLQARLYGGQPGDEVSWQKPQLFRQTKGDPNAMEPSFSFSCSL